MNKKNSIAGKDKQFLWHPFTQAQTAPDAIPVRSAKGAVLYGEDGTEYLDLISSWWVTLHGHAQPEIVEAIHAQAAKLEHVIFAGFTHETAVAAAEGLLGLLPRELTRVFYSDDGSTAVEVALKLAYQYWQNVGTPKKRFLAFDGGYHGDTVGAMSVGRGSGFFEAWGDLLFDVHAVPFPATWDGDPDVEEKEQESRAGLDRYLDAFGADTVAMILEPLVQGAGGMRMCRPGYLRDLVARLKAAGVLVIFDEVMTGFGRTGETFACLKAEVTPDIICLSKGLTGGFLPLAATVSREEIYAAFLGANFSRAFTHGHSFTANPLGCAAAIASMKLLRAPETQKRIAGIANLHRERLAALAAVPALEHPRRMGTIAAIDVKAPDAGYEAAVGARLKAYFRERGLLIRPLGNVIYLLPPYCVGDDPLHRAYDAIEAAARELA